MTALSTSVTTSHVTCLEMHTAKLFLRASDTWIQKWRLASRGQPSPVIVSHYVSDMVTVVWRWALLLLLLLLQWYVNVDTGVFRGDHAVMHEHHVDDHSAGGGDVISRWIMDYSESDARTWSYLHDVTGCHWLTARRCLSVTVDVNYYEVYRQCATLSRWPLQQSALVSQ